MYTIKRLALLSLLFSSTLLNGKEIVLDKIVARVNGRNILKSHLEEPRLVKNSQKFSLDEIITDDIMVQKAAELNAAPSTAELDSTFNAEKIAFGGKEMTTEKFEATRLKELGLTLDQYRNQLFRYIASERLMIGLIAKNIIVTAQEIEDFYQKNPVKTPAKFYIMIADAQKLKKPANLNSEEALAWFEKHGQYIGGFEKHEMDDAIRQAVLKLKPGTATEKPVEHLGKLKHILLKRYQESGVEPLSTRYNDIKNTLRDEHSEPYVKNFITDAKNRAYITYP